MGDLSCKSTRLGNLLCARTLVILWLCAAQSIWFVLEQPSSSLMELHCLFQRFIRRVPLRKLTIRMADFGSDTAKPTILYSSFLLIKFRATCIFFHAIKIQKLTQAKKQCPCLVIFWWWVNQALHQSSVTISPNLETGHRAIDDLPNYKTARRLVEREMVRRYINQKGEHRICGGKDLKSSQAYPRGFLGTIVSKLVLFQVGGVGIQ